MVAGSVSHVTFTMVRVEVTASEGSVCIVHCGRIHYDYLEVKTSP